MLARSLAIVFNAVESDSRPVSGIKKLAIFHLLQAHRVLAPTLVNVGQASQSRPSCCLENHPSRAQCAFTWPPSASATRSAAGFASGMLRFPGALLWIACSIAAKEFAPFVAVPALANAPGAPDFAPSRAISAAPWAAAVSGFNAGTGVFAAGALCDELPDGIPSAVDRFWLMSINCSRLFTFTSWLMYSFGSVSAVGSWFCISVTSSVRKSLAEMVAELELGLVWPPLPPFAGPAIGADGASVTALAPIACAA